MSMSNVNGGYGSESAEGVSERQAAEGVSENIVRPLLNWYRDNYRRLPWREDTDPYHVWISEIMLQQTRIEAVIPYYLRFTEQLPDIRALSLCGEERLLKLWEGLGYYSRARNLKKSAEVLCETNGGRMYDSYDMILTLPGIGPYTAGAVASISFGEAVPAVDGNVLRVAARLEADGGNILDTAVAGRLGKKVESIIPGDAPGDFNQALMELGETICLPKEKPKCGECPISDQCRWFESGLEGQIPVREKKTERKQQRLTVFVITDGERVMIRQRPGKGLLAGMYEFPCQEGWTGKKETEKRITGMGFQVKEIRSLKEVKHVFTHIEWRMKGYVVFVRSTCIPAGADDLLAVFPEQLKEEYAVPTAFGKVFMEVQKVINDAE